MIKRPWLLYALITTLFWGIWGALIELPGKAGFPPTLVYIVMVANNDSLCPCRTGSYKMEARSRP